jgi:hypothetical protein
MSMGWWSNTGSTSRRSAGPGDPGDDVGDARQAAREAMREARGLLRVPLDPGNQYAQVLRELHTAVEALLGGGRHLVTA